MSRHHLHKLIDFVVTAFIVYDNKILLINHKELKKWLPIGGHIELHEDPKQALFREIQEECGVKFKVMSEKPALKSNSRKILYSPNFLDIHQIKGRHRHTSLNYIIKAYSDKVKLRKNEHKGIKWFTKKELNNPFYKIEKDVKYFCLKAIETVNKND